MNYKIVGIIIFIVLILLFLAFAIKGFNKILFKAFFNFVIGCVIVLILNWCGRYMGFNLPVNFLNSAIIGFLGIPGIILVFVLKGFL